MQEIKFKGLVHSEPIDDTNVSWHLIDSNGNIHNAADLLTGVDTIIDDFRTREGDEVEIIVRRKK